MPTLTHLYVECLWYILGTQAVTVPFHTIRKSLRTCSTVIVTIVSGYKIVYVIL